MSSMSHMVSYPPEEINESGKSAEMTFLVRDLIRNRWTFALCIGAYDFIKVTRYKSMPFGESAQNNAFATV